MPRAIALFEPLQTTYVRIMCRPVIQASDACPTVMAQELTSRPTAMNVQRFVIGLGLSMRTRCPLFKNGPRDDGPARCLSAWTLLPALACVPKQPRDTPGKERQTLSVKVQPEAPL